MIDKDEIQRNQGLGEMGEVIGRTAKGVVQTAKRVYHNGKDIAGGMIRGVQLLNKPKINLYVDDLRDCPKGFTIARNVQEAIKYLENYDIGILSLDHDLGVDENGELLPTGYDLVKYFCENGLYAEKIYLQTDNGVGRENMFYTLKGAQRRGYIDSNIEIFHYSITQNKYS